MAAFRYVWCLSLFCIFVKAAPPKAKEPPIAAIEQEIGGMNNINLWIVGMYIAAHKYFGVDYRNRHSEILPEDLIFFKQFPSPPINTNGRLSGLKQACQNEATACVDEVLKKAKESGSLQHIMQASSSKPLYAPFSGDKDMFEYRQTAMYYLCWHTLKEDTRLRYKDSRWYPEDGGVSCLEHLNRVHDLREDLRETLMKGAKPKVKEPREDTFGEPDEPTGEPRLIGVPIIKDVRDATFQEDVYICPMLWFCPDPCYGRQDWGNYVEEDFDPPGNPCGKFVNKECKWKQRANMNLKDLMNNKFNISCDCSGNPGYEWGSREQACVDIDECVRQTHNCSHYQICSNTIGSFVCKCLPGFDNCANTLVSDEKSVDSAAAKANNPPGKPEDTNIGGLSKKPNKNDELMMQMAMQTQPESGSVVSSQPTSLIWILTIYLTLCIV